MCVCGLIYPHAKRMGRIIFSRVTCPAVQYSSTLSYKRYNFRGKKLLNIKTCVLIFCTNFIWNISHSKKKWERYCHICVLIFMQSTRYFCEVSRKLEISRQIFEKYSSQILRSSVQWEPSCSMRAGGRTDRHDEANSRLSQFCEHVSNLVTFPPI
jgi:hypothetical protein